MTLYQNCSNGSAPQNKMSARAKKNLSMSFSPKMLDWFWNNFIEMLGWTATKIVQTGLLCWKRWPPELKKKKQILNDLSSWTSGMDFETRKMHLILPTISLYNMDQVSDPGPLWPSCFKCCWFWGCFNDMNMAYRWLFQKWKTFRNTYFCDNIWNHQIFTYYTTLHLNHLL